MFFDFNDWLPPFIQIKSKTGRLHACQSGLYAGSSLSSCTFLGVRALTPYYIPIAELS